MSELKICLILFYALFLIQVKGQISVQTSAGIENPYKYFYNVNVSPSPNTEPLELQKFRFFRTKIFSVGAIYEYTLPIFKEKIGLNFGGNIGFMDQFVADTIVSPTQIGLIYNAKHKNVFFTPEIGLKIQLYKIVWITGGIEIFIPFQKWIHSDDGYLKFNRDYSPKFYSINAYSSIGLELDFKTIKLGFKFQSSGETDHWVIAYPFNNVYHEHDLERWLISVKYEL